MIYQICASVRTLVTERDDDILVLGTCYDGARLGKPLEETTSYGISDGTYGVIRVPMVPLCVLGP